MKIPGITENDRNPFARDAWVVQNHLLTEHRRAQLRPLFGKTVEAIWKGDDNEEAYPAFVGIRWGFAEVRDGRLEPTEEWNHLADSDGFGEKRTLSRVRKTGRTSKSSDATGRNGDPADLDFRSEEELVSWLANARDEIVRVIENYRRRDLNGKSPDELIRFSVDPTIHRFFWHETPSARYGRWRWQGRGKEILAEMEKIAIREDFDRFAYALGKSLMDDWGTRNEKNQPSKMTFGVSMKIVNLVLKHLAYSSHSRNRETERFLHVPWDKFTLQPLRRTFNETAREKGLPPIRNGQGMGYVLDFTIYSELLARITHIAQNAKVPRIHYEFLAWDRSHP